MNTVSIKFYLHFTHITFFKDSNNLGNTINDSNTEIIDEILNDPNAQCSNEIELLEKSTTIFQDINLISELEKRSIEFEKESFNVSELQSYRKRLSNKISQNVKIVSPSKNNEGRVLQWKNNNFLKYHFIIKDFNFVFETMLKKYSKNKTIQDLYRVHFEQISPECNIQFQLVRINNTNIVAYAYCHDSSCVTYTFKRTYNGEVNVYTTECVVTHTLGFRKTYQTRGLQRIVEKNKILKKYAFQYNSDNINKLSDNLLQEGKNPTLEK